MAKKVFVVVAYDIVNDRKRKKVAKLLEEYGLRINYSVFELAVSPSDINKIKKRIGTMISKKSDSVLFYYLCKECIVRNEYIGTIALHLPTVHLV